MLNKKELEPMIKIIEPILDRVTVDEGFKEAYDTEAKRRGVVNNEGVFEVTYPLNGHRMRNLSEKVFGVRQSSMLELGKCFITNVGILKGLPGFDQFYYDRLAELPWQLAIVHVVMVDNSYGAHIRVIQA